MEREALHAAAVQFSLDLHPSATGDVMEGVRDQLNSSLLRSVLYACCTDDVTWQPAVHPLLPAAIFVCKTAAAAGQVYIWMVF